MCSPHHIPCPILRTLRQKGRISSVDNCKVPCEHLDVGRLATSWAPGESEEVQEAIRAVQVAVPSRFLMVVHCFPLVFLWFSLKKWAGAAADHAEGLDF